MNTDSIRAICTELDAARKQLEAAILARNNLNLNGHQKELRVACGDLVIPVSYLDRSTGYSSTLIRGCDMILLGMKKVANANIDYHRTRVAALEAKLADTAAPLPASDEGGE